MISLKAWAVGIMVLAPIPAYAQSTQPVQLKDLVGMWVGGPIWIYQRSTPFHHQTHAAAMAAGIAARLAALGTKAADTAAIRKDVADSLDKAYIAYVLQTAPDTLIIWPDTTFSSTMLALGPHVVAKKSRFELLPGDTVKWTFPTLWHPFQLLPGNQMRQTGPASPRVVVYHIDLNKGQLHWLGVGSLIDENSYYRRISRTPNPSSSRGESVVAPGPGERTEDTTLSEPRLTAAQLRAYLAVKRALEAYWGASDHAALLRTARRGGRQFDLDFAQGTLAVGSFNYPALVTQDTALAALFTRQHLTPADFVATQFEVLHALGALFTMDYLQATPPGASTVLAENVALVRPYRDTLAAVGVTVQGFTVLLTDTLVRRYVALKQALRAYWRDSTHAALLAAAQAGELHPGFVAVETYWSKIGRAYDYSQLVQRDTALAGVFRRAQFAPALYESLQVATWQASMYLLAHEADPEGEPLPGGVVGDNVAIVATHRQALAGIGVVPYTKLPAGTIAWAFVRTPDGVLECNVMQP